MRGGGRGIVGPLLGEAAQQRNGLAEQALPPRPASGSRRCARCGAPIRPVRRGRPHWPPPRAPEPAPLSRLFREMPGFYGRP
ncbi:hypothetical protein AMK16_04285 [Streptomyces sp. CB00455]|nr:hypothetical protein AMK16_04285 [Streptomyces sp. CB00455]